VAPKSKDNKIVANFFQIQEVVRACQSTCQILLPSVFLLPRNPALKGTESPPFRRKSRSAVRGIDLSFFMGATVLM
jgi:hypothetical protein